MTSDCISLNQTPSFQPTDRNEKRDMNKVITIHWMSSDHCLWSRLLVVIFCPLKNGKELCCQSFCAGVVDGLLVWERNANYRVCRCSCRLVFGRCRVRIWAATQTVPTESFCVFLTPSATTEMLPRLVYHLFLSNPFLVIIHRSSYRPRCLQSLKFWHRRKIHHKKGRKNYGYLKTRCSFKL